MKVTYVYIAIILALTAFYGLPVAGEDTCGGNHDNCQTNANAEEGSVHPDDEAADEPSDNISQDLIFPGEVHFANMRQLTFSGENAEAYFSADGTRLILQFHEGSDKCDQIYIMDIESGETNLVSTGGGVTTCSYFQYPNDDKIIYASTHHYGMDCPPKPDQSLGYVWKLYEEFDIFRADPDGSNLEQLTDAWGYDAEGTYAEDGSKIIYTSLQSGDLEIWTMNPDGSDKTMLTDTLGYDGGAWFSHDGTKIVWRGFYPETEEEIADYTALLAESVIRPMDLQIRVMNADGTNQVQVTDNDAANFGPFWLPDDKRIIFASNFEAASHMDFNLWIVNEDGTGMERVTYYDGFDGFPMFSPDGTKFVFASNRFQEKPGDTNIFICDWVE